MYFQMSVRRFEDLVHLVGSHLEKMTNDFKSIYLFKQQLIVWVKLHYIMCSSHMSQVTTSDSVNEKKLLKMIKLEVDKMALLAHNKLTSTEDGSTNGTNRMADSLQSQQDQLTLHT